MPIEKLCAMATANGDLIETSSDGRNTERAH